MAKIRNVRARRGAAAVEFAFMVPIMLIVSFAIMEYCRYLMLLNLANNACRNGARYASVNTANGTPPPSGPGTVTTANIQARVTADMCGQQKALTGSGSFPPPLVYRANPATGAPATDATGPNWYAASYGEPIAVQINGQYKPIFGGAINFAMPPTFTVTVMVNSEGN